MKPLFKCINNCTSDVFSYVGISNYTVFMNEENEVKTIINNGGQANRTVCLRCGKDATQIFEKCKICGCWKKHLMKGLCLSCYTKNNALKKGEK